MNRRLMAVLVVGVVIGLAGCKKQQEAQQPMSQNEMNEMSPAQAPAEVPSAKAVIRQATPDEVGKQAFCPVMKENFKVSKITQASDYKGKTYYFCCNACPPEVQKNPDKYAK